MFITAVEKLLDLHHGRIFGIVIALSLIDPNGNAVTVSVSDFAVAPGADAMRNVSSTFNCERYTTSFSLRYRY
jgi:hypothetical protein